MGLNLGMERWELIWVLDQTKRELGLGVELLGKKIERGLG